MFHEEVFVPVGIGYGREGLIMLNVAAETGETQERADRDGAWKDAISLFLPQLLQRMLGESKWILLHIEVQGIGGGDLTYRMMLYCCLIFSHHHEMPVALAILTSPRPKEENSGYYEATEYGTSLSYCYNCFPVYCQEDDALLSSDNPFDLLIYAAKKEASFKGKDKEMQKFGTLREIVRLLESKGWNEKDRRDILILVTRLVNLRDKGLQLRYVEEIKERKGTMAETFIEKYFRDEGRAEGRAEGRNEALNAAASFLKASGMTAEQVLQFRSSVCANLGI